MLEKGRNVLRILAIAALLAQVSSACAIANPEVRQAPSSISGATTRENLQEAAFQARSLAIREQLAAQDLNQLDTWWRSRNIGDPHKYLLPAILARLSLSEQYNPQQSWDILLKLDQDKPDLYHFRSVFDPRIFFEFRDKMPADVEASYRSMVASPRVLQWLKTGTENHMFMHRLSGLALMDGSGFPVGDPATPASIEAWLRSEVNKFLTIGQGEFHSSTYYGYTIGGLLNLYDFAKTPELRQLAKAALDWLAVNMALRLSWGTAGGAESRGFDRGTWDESELAGVAWIWWGDRPETAQRLGRSAARVALLAALSDYRPPSQFREIARKEVALPFSARASHPGYYSYHQGNRSWENFYVTSDYSLGTLLERQRSYEVKGTINGQYATYKLVVRDPKGQNNAVVSLAGTFHNPMATGRSPGDQYVQERSAVIYQLRLNERDKAANVPPRSHLVLPARYGEPLRHGAWYIWRIEGVWLCARPWGDTIRWEAQVSERNKDYQVLVANGDRTAWITDVASIADYPDFARLRAALDQRSVNDRNWKLKGELEYSSFLGDRLSMTYEPNGAIARASINGKARVLEDWPVLESPYVRQDLNSGVLEVLSPQGIWGLRGTLNGPRWESER